MPSLPVEPEWLDYKRDIQQAKAGKADVLYVQNKDNQLFRQTFLIDMGSWNDKLLPLAGNYLSYLGTDKMTDRKSTRLNSSHVKISYAVFCLKKKKKKLNKQINK